jgi:hypothetical protein
MSKYVLTLSNYNGGIMIQFMEMTPAEAHEAHNHFILHDMADLCLSQGFEPTMEQLIAIINSKVDNLEPV